jgi:hypothetical protein
VWRGGGVVVCDSAVTVRCGDGAVMLMMMVRCDDGDGGGAVW